MSVLSLPRIHFKGFTKWSPSTANNHDAVYDEAAAAPILQSGWTYQDYVDQLKTENPAWCEPWGSWNLFGDHGVVCEQTAVTGVQLSGGPPVSDPICGAAVNIQGRSWVGTPAAGRLVMTDPFSWGSETSMIVFDSIVLGSGALGFTAKAASPLFSKWGFRPSDQATAKTVGCPAPGAAARNLNLKEDLIFEGTESCCWWVGLANAGLQWAGSDQSPALAALRRAAEAGGNQGIVFRFVSYCTQYYVTYPNIKNGLDLVKAYTTEGFTGDNPARSVMLGSIGVWGPGELSSAPTELSLTASGTATVPSTPTLAFSLGPAMAKVDTDRGVVVLDLVNAIPELDTTLVKADLGPLDLCAGGSRIGSLPYTAYDQSAYETSAGICEIPIPEGMTVTGPLSLSQAGGPPLLTQDEFLAETDDWVVYLDEDQTRQITVTVMQNGAAAPAGTSLLLVQYNSRTGDILPASQPIVRVVDQQGKAFDPPVVPVVDGKAIFSLQPVVSGACVVGFFPYQGQPPTPPAVNYPMPNYRYACIRALPFDNALEAGTPDSALTWEFLYTNVLRAFDLMYPAMSKVVSLASLPAVQGMAVQLKAAIDANTFPSPLYMPITRDLSAGKRRLLQRFVNLMA